MEYCLDGTTFPSMILNNNGSTVGYSLQIVTAAGGFLTRMHQTNDIVYRRQFPNKLLFGVGTGNSTMSVANSKIGINTYAADGSLHVVGGLKFVTRSAKVRCRYWRVLSIA
jgi:hypothetical protein